jgi:hypothetical protein
VRIRRSLERAAHFLSSDPRKCNPRTFALQMQATVDIWKECVRNDGRIGGSTKQGKGKKKKNQTEKLKGDSSASCTDSTLSRPGAAAQDGADKRAGRRENQCAAEPPRDVCEAPPAAGRAFLGCADGGGRGALGFVDSDKLSRKRFFFFFFFFFFFRLDSARSFQPHGGCIMLLDTLPLVFQ